MVDLVETVVHPQHRCEERLAHPGPNEITDEMLVGEMTDRRQVRPQHEIGDLVERLDRRIEDGIATVDATESMQVVKTRTDDQMMGSLHDPAHARHLEHPLDRPTS